MSKKEKAKELLKVAKKLGSEITLKNGWVIVTPPLPFEYLETQLEVSNELKELLNE